jgi:putative PIN family toxin of toxin-antitoxin system
VKLLFSEELLGEVLEVIARPKLRRFFSADDVSELLGYFNLYGLFVNVVSEVDLCRDKKDNFLLALAKDGNADCLITGDKDLLAIGRFGKTSIRTLAEFEKTI